MIHPPSSLLIFDGMNDAGLVFNCNAYPDTGETPDTGGEGVKIQGVTGISTEYTTNSFLADAPRTRYYVRDYTALNWSVFDLTRLASGTSLRLVPLASLAPLGGDATELLPTGRT